MSANENPPTPAESSAPPPRRLAGKLRFLWPTLLLFVLGIAAGWHWNRSFHVPESRASKAPTHTEPRLAATSTRPGATDLTQGDALLRDERFGAALTAYSALEMADGGALDGTLHYRSALCLEGLGRWDQALAAYQEVMGQSKSITVAAAAQVGQARVWLKRGQSAEARTLLYPLLWRSQDESLQSQPLLAEAHYLLALTLAREAVPLETPSTFHDAVTRPGEPLWSATRALAWIAAPPATKSRPARLAAGIRVARPAGPNAMEVTIDANVQDQPIADLVERLASLGSLNVDWSPEARLRIEHRTATLALQDWLVLEVVRALTDLHDLVGEVSGETLRLRTQREASAEDLAAQRSAGAGQALRLALHQDPGHPLSPAAYLELGNLETRAKNWTAAIGWYERLLREAPRSAPTREANYNLGVSARRLGDYVAARRAFFKVIDRTPGHRLATLAYLRLGQMYLDEGRPREAISPLRRAVSFAEGTEAQGEIALFLAAAQLLAGDPRSGHDSLVQQREHVHREPQRREAAFLDALALFRLVSNRKESRLEAGELLAALIPVTKENRLGAVGELLLGQAYRDLGLNEQMAEVFEESRKEAPVEIAAEMAFELAEWWSGGPRRAEAVQLYSTLAARPQSRWSAPARLRLAALDLQEGRASECLQACRELLAEPQSVERAAVLQVMGRAFERLGDHPRAALCFSGQIPDW